MDNAGVLVTAVHPGQAMLGVPWLQGFSHDVSRIQISADEKSPRNTQSILISKPFSIHIHSLAETDSIAVPLAVAGPPHRERSDHGHPKGIADEGPEKQGPFWVLSLTGSRPWGNG
jgi:hypothetical protein